MNIFKNILVGIDLAQCKPLQASALGPIAREAIEHAIHLARRNSAKLLILSAVNISDEVLTPLPEEDREQVREAMHAAGGDVLDDVVDEACRAGVEASWKIVAGKGWSEIIRQVLRDRHDLVVVGTRNLTGIRRMLFGNTAMKLLRRCPCPVLITRLGTEVSHPNILIAIDFKSAAEETLRLGIALAEQTGGHVHVLHVVEYPLDRLWSTGLPDAKQVAYHRAVREQAETTMHTLLDKTDYRSLGDRVHIHLADGVGIADVAIQHFLQVHHIHLLVMGTIGRGGLPGIMIGNTAERLLPEVHCSVLAVKPPNFVCPVQLED